MISVLYVSFNSFRTYDDERFSYVFKAESQLPNLKLKSFFISILATSLSRERLVYDTKEVQAWLNIESFMILFLFLFGINKRVPKRVLASRSCSLTIQYGHVIRHVFVIWAESPSERHSEALAG